MEPDRESFYARERSTYGELKNWSEDNTDTGKHPTQFVTKKSWEELGTNVYEESPYIPKYKIIKLRDACGPTQ
jgi:hypothetical protein